MEVLSEDPLPPDDLRCKRTDGRDWRCKQPVADGKSFCPSHLHRRQKQQSLSPPPPTNPNPEHDPIPKPTIRIRVRVKPEPADEIHSDPTSVTAVPQSELGSKPVPVIVPDHLRCHRNDGRSWRCKKQVLEGLTLCEVHFNRAKAQNQRRPARKKKVQGPISAPIQSPELVVAPEILRCERNNGKDWRCKKRVVEGETRCETHLKKRSNCKDFKLSNCNRSDKQLEKDTIGAGDGGGDALAVVPETVQAPGSVLLPPDNLRCTRNDGREWRCKRRVMEGQNYCEVHLKRIKIKDLVVGEKKKQSVSKRKKKMDNAGNASGGGGGGGGSSKAVIKVENNDVVQDAVVALAVTGDEGVERSEKAKGKPVVTAAVDVEKGVVRKEKAKRKPVETVEAVAAVEDDEFRCKRTDGRGWRCKRRVLEGKTLCEIHYEQGRLRQLKITVPEELKIQRGEGSEKVEKRLKRKKELEILENNSDKGMKRMRAELIRVFLRREIIESTKKSEKRVEDSGEVMKELPFGSMAIPPAPPSHILGNAESLGIKIGAHCSNSLVMRRFRSKNIEPPLVGPVKVVPFPGKADKVRSSGRRKCHWCNKSENLCLSKCSSCRKRYFCSICIEERSIDPKEVKLRCPVCCGTCHCISCCATTQIKATSSKEVLKEKCKGTKFQRLEYLINFLLPILVQINQEQAIELEVEAKFKGQNPSDVEIRQADVGCRDQCCCNNCKTPIVDFHRSCPNCSYNLCLTCCREYTQGGSLCGTNLNETSKLMPCLEKSLEATVDLASITSLRISCPPMELGGCDNSLLDLRCIFPLNWTKELEISAKETLSELDSQQNLDDSLHCPLCTNIIKVGDKNKELQEVSRRRESNDNFLYCPSTSDDANSLLAHFQKHWRKGHPVKVRNVLKCASALNWDPLAIFCGYLEKGFSNNCKKMEEASEAVSCSGSYDVEVGTKESFTRFSPEGFMQVHRETLKLKAKISTAFSQKLLGGNYTETICALPLQEYTNPRMGLFNIAGKLPDDFSASKLGPHVCISCGSRDEVARGDLVNKLCCNYYDEVSILVHVGDVTVSTEQLNKMKKLIKRNNNMEDQGQTSSKNLEDDEARLNGEISVEAGEQRAVAGASCCSGATIDTSIVDNIGVKFSPVKQVNGSDTDSDASMICSRASHSPDKAVDQLPPRDNSGTCNVNDKHHPSEPCGAQWDVFRRQDMPKLVEYLLKHVKEISSVDGLSNNVHPIFDGSYYLDAVHKMQLKEEFDIEPWTFNQCLGEAVFIPAGCPYQIRNVKSCVNIAVGFISPENASECIKLMNEIRVLPNNHKAKQMKLEVEKMTICTIDEAIKEIYRLMIEEGNR